MSTETNQPQEKRNSDFGLPQAEFRPLPEQEGGWLKVIIITLVIVLIISAGAAYWFFYHAPASSQEKAYLETNDIAIDDEFIEDEALSIPPTVSDNKVHGNLAGNPDIHEPEVANGNVEAAKATLPTQPSQKPAKGTVTTVDTPQGSYYVVVGSFIDEDLASDHAKQLAKQGTDVTILAPESGEYFFRVAVTQADTLYAAHEKIEELKASHGNNIWVKKY